MKRTELARRTPLARTSQPLRTTRLRPVSEVVRQRKTERRLAVARAADRDHHTCQAQHVWPHDCWGPLVGHEPRKRSQGGNPNEVDQILTVCWLVNGRIEDEPNWARSLGLAVHGWESWSWSENWKAKR